MITGRQIRAARGLLEWTVEDLARQTGLSRLTVSKIEADAVSPHPKSLSGIVNLFDRKGVEFLDDDGVRMRKREIRVFSGKNGYRQFLDHIYETVRYEGGRICQFASDGKYLRFADDYAESHLQRMSKVENLNARVLTIEGDKDFPATYCQYRWMDKSAKTMVPFYVYNDHVVMSLQESANKRELISINSKLLAERYVQQFDAVWAKGIKPKTNTPRQNGRD